MPAPRWFYVILAACAISLTFAAVASLRFKSMAFPQSEGVTYLDTWTGELCLPYLYRRGKIIFCSDRQYRPQDHAPTSTSSVTDTSDPYRDLIPKRGDSLGAVLDSVYGKRRSPRPQ